MKQPTTKQIMEYNKLIAKFLGYVLHEGRWYLSGKESKESAFVTSDLSFHRSWETLMPVVEKIENDFNSRAGVYFVRIFQHSCIITLEYEQSEQIVKSVGETKILAVYKAVVDFIMYINPTKTK